MVIKSQLDFSPHILRQPLVGHDNDRLEIVGQPPEKLALRVAEIHGTSDGSLRVV